MGLGYVEGYTHDYIRHGTTLFAALDVATGKVIGGAIAILAFLRIIDRRPNSTSISFNYATHKHPKVGAWLAKRFHLHFTPTGFMANQVERWFGLISQRAIKRGSFDSVAQLVKTIEGFIANHNASASPFVWVCDAHAMLGRLPLAQVMAPAIEAAQAGIEIAWSDLLALAAVSRHFDAFPDTRAAWTLGGVLPSLPFQSAQRHRIDARTALAATLRRIAARGKRGFYAGRTAKALDGYMRSNGGILSGDDLDAYRTRVLREWPQRYRNHDYVTCFDQVGYEALNLLGHFDLRRHGSDSHAYRHLVAEALAVAFTDNMIHYGDPDFENAPVYGLASPGFAAHRRRALRVRSALPRPVEAGNPWPYERFVDAPERIETRTGAARIAGTSQVAAADREGNMASVCMSIGGTFGSLVHVPDLGIVLNNAMQNFDPRPDHPNSIKPGKMPIFAAPVLVAARDREGRFAGAGSGGYRIESAVLHTFLNVIDHRMRIQRAIDHPRVHCQGRETWVDRRIPPAVRRRLARAGHEVTVVDEDPGSLHFGRVAAVTREPRSGVLRAGAGPVWRTGAAGY